MAAGLGAHDFDRFRALVFEDERLRDELGGIEDAQAFIDLSIAAAAARGIALKEHDLEAARRVEMLGLARFEPRPWGTAPPPQTGWLPVHVSNFDDRHYIDWAFFGTRRLTQPFYEDSIRKALRLPFNRLFRFSTPLSELAQWTQHLSCLQPSGFVFHMSRCGSTLAAQMLAALPQNIVLSEASPIEAVVQLARAAPAQSMDALDVLLTQMVGILGHRRGGETHSFVKTDCWHTLALPMFRRVFPSVPWVFLYREPVEVLVSQIQQRGIQTVPEFIPPQFYGLDMDSGVADEEYCARVLGRVCGAALDSYASGGGLLVNYSQLPEALWTKILPHFGIDCSDADRDAMLKVARFDAKTPSLTFSPDGQSKRQTTTPAIRSAAEQFLDPVYRRLEALRRGAEGQDSLTEPN